jgi:hypothetical protein
VVDLVHMLALTCNLEPANRELILHRAPSAGISDFREIAFWALPLISVISVMKEPDLECECITLHSSVQSHVIPEGDY